MSDTPATNGEVLPPPKGDRNAKGQFVSGHSKQFQPGNPGRREGTRPLLSQRMLNELAEEWPRKKQSFLSLLTSRKETVRVRAWQIYFSTVIPKEINIHTAHSPLDDMDREELRQFATTIERALKAVATDPQAAQRLLAELPRKT